MPKRRRYSEADIAAAISDVENGVSLSYAAATYAIPRTTLRNRTTSSQSRGMAHKNQQRLSGAQEEGLVEWILRQEALGYAPTHAQLRGIATKMLQKQGESSPLGKRWPGNFLKRQPRIKTKLGRRTDWQRISCTNPDNINKLFDLYQTVAWIPSKRRYNADEGGIMAGMGVNGLVIGSSSHQAGQVPVKTDHSRSWTSFVECISAVGVALNPLVIFKAKSIQDQWFQAQILLQHPTWHITFSKNGWTSNAIALEWLVKVFLPETDTGDQSDARLLIVDGHGSHTTDDFIAECFLNNVYLLFLPAHTSHVTQPLDLGCFSALKTAYRRQLCDFVALTDAARVDKPLFLQFYAEARKAAFTVKNISAGWKATGLYPCNRYKALNNRWVVAQRLPTPPPKQTSDISTPKKSQDISRMLGSSIRCPSARLAVRKISKGFDKYLVETILLQQKIDGLQAELEAIRPVKRKKVQRNPNERLVTLAEIASQRGSEPIKPAIFTPDEVVSAEEDEQSVIADESLVRRSGRVPRHIYVFRGWEDDSSDEKE